MVKLPCSRRGNHEMYIASVTPYKEAKPFLVHFNRMMLKTQEYPKKTLKTTQFKVVPAHLNFQQNDAKNARVPQENT